MAVFRPFSSRLAAMVLTVATVAALSAPQADAAMTQVFDRAGLNGDLTVNWDLFGPAGTVTGAPETRTVGAVAVSVSSSAPGLLRADGGLGFADGEALLRDNFTWEDSFTIRFDPNVRGFGFSLQATRRDIGDYTGLIEIFDINSDRIGSLPFAGRTDAPPIFVGGLSDAVDIGTIRIGIDNFPGEAPRRGGAAAINRMDLVLRNADPPSVATPATLALVLVPVAAFAMSLGLIRAG